MSSVVSRQYSMPAEWEPHEGTFIAWPHNVSHWPGKFETIPPIYGALVCALAEGGEKVFICVNDEETSRSARLVIALSLKQSGTELFNNIFFHRIPTNASWSRDHGPIFVRDSKGALVITDWIFNAWGGKYPPWDLDDAVPERIAEIFKIPRISPGIVLEGGSIEVNGKGTLLTTEQCLLNKNRNPHLSRAEIENYFLKYLGAKNILWLKEGIVGDDTDGHIDDIARFVDERTVVCCVEENMHDSNYKILQENFEALKKMRDQDGNLLRALQMPMPDPVFCEGERLPASYANFYIANKAVIVPTFNCPRDKKALKILGELFPTRKIIPIDGVDYVWGLGTVHCSTQQMPKM